MALRSSYLQNGQLQHGSAILQHQGANNDKHAVRGRRQLPDSDDDIGVRST